MGSDICVNVSCAAPCGHERKRGWRLRSGGFAQLCINCGSAYEGAIFCSTFHLKETGWRECSFCKKAIHCGCIVSMSLFEHLDFGGISCISCLKASQFHLVQKAENPKWSVSSTKSDASQRDSDHIDGKLFVGGVDEGKLMQLCRIAEASESNHWPQAQRDAMIPSSGQNSQEVRCFIKEADTGFSNGMKPSVQSLTFGGRPTWESKDRHESHSQPSLSMLLGTPSGNSLLPSAGEIAEGRAEGKPSPPFHQGQRSRPIFPKPVKIGPSKNLDTSAGMISETRIARPPADGRGKNQLLPRYWPRITDQELEQLSGDLKSTIVPLFEKVLSASDAGRIGRLVLPKACAEAYFPAISHSEGLPLRIQDVKGNEWTFQFRFWPNNNSRMYVLEGVTPCIQSMDLRAGDTVTFSRIDPGGKLVMGFRKASNSVDTQEASTSVISNGISMKEKPFSGGTEMASGINYSDLLQSKGNGEPHLNGLSEHLTLSSWDASLRRTETFGDKKNNDPLQKPVSVEKKRTRNIGPKSKRLLIHSEDAHELRLTWEEAQDLLRPPPSVKPSIVTIEDHVFEEYDEPPVFGKRTIFSVCQSGEHEQWAQCDDCCKWRRLPVDALLPPKWTCPDNVWDASRSLCSAQEELNPKELENLLRNSRDLKKQRIGEDNKSPQDHEPSGLDALASVAILGDNLVDPAESSAGPTTRHPRHRPGCTCIVCIQPPSGKGRHKPTCTCNVCMTVKRRFKTLMLRKKKRQSEREADNEQNDNILHRDELEKNGSSRDETNNSEKEGSLNRGLLEVGESSAGQIDLNCDPDREDMQIDVRGLSLTTHLETSHYPLPPLYINQNGLRSLDSEQHATPHSGLFPQSNSEARRYLPHASIVRDHERRDDEVYCDPQSSQSKLS